MYALPKILAFLILANISKQKNCSDIMNQNHPSMHYLINSQSLEDTQVGYISQKYTLDKYTLEKYT